MEGSSVNREKKSTCRTIWRRQKRAKRKHHGLMSIRTDPPSQQGDMSEVADSAVPMLNLDEFPEDILHHIHSFVPLREAARAACVSRKFLRSWRCFPNLAFNWKTFGLDKGTRDERAKKLVDGIQNIMKNHSGNGLKTLKLSLYTCGNIITIDIIDIWLQDSIKSGIVELDLDLPQDLGPKYKFPCSLLSYATSSLQSLSISCCVFQPVLTIGSFINLKSVCLVLVHITGEELGCLFSCALSLEKFEISRCHMVTFMKIPSYLQLLCFLRVCHCGRLQMIEICAPKVTTFVFNGPPMKITGDSSQIQNITMNGVGYCGMFQYALAKLNSIAPNLQTLTVLSSGEALNMPMSPEKFLHLRHLKIHCPGIGFRTFDYLSLVVLLEACPVLESFVLSACNFFKAKQDAILDSNANPLHVKRIPEFHHDTLKKVTITEFCSSKSLIELTRQILRNCSSLRCLVLDTTSGKSLPDKCHFLDRDGVIKAFEGIEAIKRYIKGNVPSGVKFEVLEPCSQCHISQL